MTAELSTSQKELVISLNDQPDTLTVKDTDHDLKFWFPTLFGLYEIVMSCELEVRTRWSLSVLRFYFRPSFNRIDGVNAGPWSTWRKHSRPTARVTQRVSGMWSSGGCSSQFSMTWSTLSRGDSKWTTASTPLSGCQQPACLPFVTSWISTISTLTSLLSSLTRCLSCLAPSSSKVLPLALLLFFFIIFFFLTFLMLRSLQRTTHSPESAARVWRTWSRPMSPDWQMACGKRFVPSWRGSSSPPHLSSPISSL